MHTFLPDYNEKFGKFIEKQATPEEKARLEKILTELKVLANGMQIPLPYLKRVPESDDAPWSMYWDNDSEHYSVNLSKKEDVDYYYSLNKGKNNAIGEESATFPADFAVKVLKFRHSRVKNDDGE